MLASGLCHHYYVNWGGVVVLIVLIVALAACYIAYRFTGGDQWAPKD